ncbi:SMI1/KNR4 family protein [Halpernia sp. GG3]
MKNFEKIKNLIYKFESLGIKESKYGAVLIGKAPHIGTDAWLNEIYPILDTNDIVDMENMLKTNIPLEYKDFLLSFSNGLGILVSTFSLYGLRKLLGRDIETSRQPYSIKTPNIPERPKNANENYFFIRRL